MLKNLFILTAILSLVGCKQRTLQSNKIEKYVSMTCSTGDITMTLNSDKTFDMTILFWDNKTKQHIGQQNINGTWTKADSILTLQTSDKNRIIYSLTTTKIKIGNNQDNVLTYAFKSNDKNFFGTGFELLDQKQTDNILNKSTQ